MYYTCMIFFFQAEDGIRDVAVTGVQTCALPIYGCDIEKKDVPETHLFRKLLDGIRGAVRRLAHRVWSSAGMRSSCLRKLTINGSSELSNPPQGPKYVTRPSCRKTMVSASFFAKCVSCVTTIEVL